MKHLGTILLTAALIGALAVSGWQWNRAQEANMALLAQRDRAYFSAVDGLSSLETDISKTAAASSPGLQALFLGRISAISQGVGEHLSLITENGQESEDGLKFLSQLSDYSQTLAAAAAEGRTLTDQDLQQILRIQARCGELKSALSGGEGFRFEESFETADLSGIEYPTLLYDGPFSDGVVTGNPRGLEGMENVTKEQALEIARQFVGEERVVSVEETQALSGPVPCYGVRIVTNDVTLTAQITRQGGKVLWMSPETAGFESRMDIDECRLHARAFLESRGFGEMVMRYHQVYDGLAVMNFAPLQEGVVIYPDLIKVQARLDTGEVVGMEANHYWMNHYNRKELLPDVEEEAAQAALSPRLSVGERRLCIIPRTDGLGSGQTERLCWEFEGEADGSRFLVYIDASTGEEAEVLKVMESQWGWMTE